MSVDYDLYKIKDLGNEENQGKYRARFVSKGTVSTEKLIDWVHQTSGFNHGTVRGVLTCLSDGMMNYLENGYEIEIDELGHFSILLTSRTVEDKKDIRAESVSFKKLLFQANKKVRRRLSGIVASRVAIPTAQSSETSREERAAVLRNYLAVHPCATRADYARITKTLKSKAVNDLNEFIREGWLRKYGSGRTVVYLLVAGCRRQ